MVPKSKGKGKKTQKSVPHSWEMRIKIFFAAAMLICVGAIGFMGISQLTHAAEEEKIVATVNGEPVTSWEFKQQLAVERASVSSYFYNKYKAQEDKGFWKRNYEGEVPIEMVRSKALENIKKIKVELMFAKQHEVLEDISYDHFLKELKQENQRRQEAVKKHQAIYGPVVYGESDYFTHVLSNAVIKVKDKLGENEYKVEGTVLQDQYEKVKQEFYNKGSKWKIQSIVLNYMDKSGKTVEGNKSPAKRLADQIREELTKGKSAEVIVAEYKPVEGITIKLETADFTDEQQRSETEHDPVVRDRVSQLKKEGEVSEVVENQPGQLAIIKCLSVEALGYNTFEEVKDSVKQRYVNKEYDKQIHQLIKDAEVKINQSVYEKQFLSM